MINNKEGTSIHFKESITLSVITISKNTLIQKPDKNMINMAAAFKGIFDSLASSNSTSKGKAWRKYGPKGRKSPKPIILISCYYKTRSNCETVNMMGLFFWHGATLNS